MATNNCTYCTKKTKINNSIEHKQGLYIHTACIRFVEENMFSGLISLNKEVFKDGEHIELINLLPDTSPQNHKLAIDLRLIVGILHKKKKAQEARALQYFIDGLTQGQMIKKFNRNRQRVSQIVISLRKELVKIGINELGYCN